MDLKNGAVSQPNRTPGPRPLFRRRAAIPPDRGVFRDASPRRLLFDGPIERLLAHGSWLEIARFRVDSISSGSAGSA